MHVERQMCRVNGDVVIDECSETAVAMGGNRLDTAPEHAVMYDEQLRSLPDCAVGGIRREIDGGRYARDLARILELQSVHGIRIVRNGVRVERRIEKADHRGEARHSISWWRCRAEAQSSA